MRFNKNIFKIYNNELIITNKTKILAFTFASFIAGIAGGLLAFYSAFAPTFFGQDRSILFLIIIVLGGLGSLTGSILAACLIVFYEQWFCMQSWVPDFFANNPKIIYGIIILLYFVLRRKVKWQKKRKKAPA